MMNDRDAPDAQSAGGDGPTPGVGPPGRDRLDVHLSAHLTPHAGARSRPGSCGEPNTKSIGNLAIAVAERLNATDSARGFVRGEFSAGFVQSFATLLVEDRYDTAEKILLRLCAGNRSYIDLAENLLGEVSRVVGARWENDQVSFSDVSIVTASLLRLRQSLAAKGGQSAYIVDSARALFVALPSQSHTLGLVLASEAFRLEGWNVEVMLNSPSDAVLQRAKAWRPKVVGLTVGRKERVRDVLDLASRLKTLPSAVRVLVGGNSVDAIAPESGADAVDAVVKDIADALRAARR